MIYLYLLREGEKGVTRKQRSKSTDHLNQNQVHMMTRMMMTTTGMMMIYIIWWGVCVSVTKNHHFPLPRWAPEARSEPKWAGFGLMIIMMMMRCIVSIPSPRERVRPGKHLSRYFSLTNPFNAVSVFVALFFSYFSSFFVQICFS